MKKKIFLSLLVLLAVGSVSKNIFALATGSGGGIVVVMEHIINDENRAALKRSPKPIASLNQEFDALNSLPEGSALLEQAAGGSTTLKDLLN